MSKKTNAPEVQQPAYIDELLTTGTTTLTAKTRDELADMVNNLPAEAKYCAGAVGHNIEKGTFTLRVDLI